MCGLCGAMSTYLSDPEVETFRELMLVNTLRGPEGAGVIAVSQGNRQVHAVKTDASGADLVMSLPFFTLMKQRRKLIVGHCRAPTKGSGKFDDIHPHKFGHIIGVHNGTLWSMHGKPIPDKTSDSMMLFQSFAEVGVEQTIETVKGAYALVWVDEKTRTLNFLRNTDRPLWFGWIGKGSPNTVYWSSERGMLEMILRRKYSVADVQLKELTADKWVRYSLDGNTGPVYFQDKQDLAQKHTHTAWAGWDNWAKDENGEYFEIPKEKNPPFTITVPVTAGSGGGVPTGTETHGHGHGAWRGRSNVTSPTRFTQMNKLREERRKRQLSYKPPNNPEATVFETLPNQFVQKEVLIRFLRSGCNWCGDTLDFENYMKNQLVFCSSSEYVCSACITNPDVQALLH